LINEKYAGDNVWSRRSFKLKQKRVRNDPGHWIRANGVFEAVVERDLFDAAHAIIGARSFRLCGRQLAEGRPRRRTRDASDGEARGNCWAPQGLAVHAASCVKCFKDGHGRYSIADLPSRIAANFVAATISSMMDGR
jgi:hypothetical protein